MKVLIVGCPYSQPFPFTFFCLRPDPEMTAVVITHHLEPAHRVFNPQHNLFACCIKDNAIVPIAHAQDLPGIMILINRYFPFHTLFSLCNIQLANQVKDPDI